MYIKRWLIIALILVSLMPLSATLAVSQTPAVPQPTPGNSIALFVGARQVDAGIRMILRNGSYYINLPFVSKFFNMVTAWNHEASDLFLKFGKTSLKLYANSPVYYINGISQKLPVAPFEQDKQFWLPLQFLLRLGLAITNQNSRQLTLDWDQNYLFGVETVAYHSRPALVLYGAKELNIHDSLAAPDRLVLELPGVTLHDSFSNQAASNPCVKRITVDRSPSGALQMVLDLNKPDGYRLVPDADNANRLMVVFNSRLEDIRLPRPGAEPKIAVKTSFPVDYQVSPGTTPNSLNLDLHDTTWNETGSFSGNQMNSPGEDGWVRQVRVSRLDSQTVRLALQFANAAPRFVVRSPADPAVLEIKTIRNLQQITWEPSGSTPDGGAPGGGAKLNLAADGEIWQEVHLDRESNQLWIDLRYMQFPANLIPPAVDRQFVNGLRLVRLSPDAARLEIALASRLINYQLELAPDRRHLTIRLRRSPLISKTVILDPGHGGEDEGACGREGLREKENNLEIALHLKELLETAGATVYLTRDDDSFVGLYERPFMANYLDANLFVSIHTNNHPDLTVRGIEVYTAPGRKTALPLAQDVMDELVKKTGFRNLGLKEDSFVVIREAQMPSILVEVGYLSNFDEESVMQTPQFKNDAAEGIFAGIADYLEAV